MFPTYCTGTLCYLPTEYTNFLPIEKATLVIFLFNRHVSYLFKGCFSFPTQSIGMFPMYEYAIFVSIPIGRKPPCYPWDAYRDREVFCILSTDVG